MRYGIPEYKLEKSTLNQRLAQMRAEGTRFVTDCEVGVDLSVEQLRAQHDAVVLAVGALRARDNDVEGRDLNGVHLAMEHLVPANKECEGDGPSAITAEGKHVVIIGGGDTGADCLGTAHRQGAAVGDPARLQPRTARAARRHRVRRGRPGRSCCAPGCRRRTPRAGSAATRSRCSASSATSKGNLRAMEIAEVKVERDGDGPQARRPGRRLAGDPVRPGAAGDRIRRCRAHGAARRARPELNRRGTLACGSDWQTDAPGVFVCGDAHRGASLIVWAIAEGRSAAHAVDAYLMGDSDLPAPVRPGALPLAVV